MDKIKLSRRLAMAGVVLIGHLFVKLNAEAAHCTGTPEQRRCPPCPRTEPGLHPSADLGFYWVCDWPDNCHHVCDDERANYNINGLLKLPGNIHRGTCDNFNNRLTSTGVINPSGQPPRQGQALSGYTGYDIRWRAQWDESGPERTRVDGRVRSCITASRFRPNFAIQITEQEVMRWVPERPVNAACSQVNLLFHQRAVDHEMEHVRRSQDVVNRANANWDQNAFSTRVCRTAATAAAADRRARMGIEQRATAYLQGAPSQDLRSQLRADEDEFHQTNTVAPIDCNLCQ